MNLKNPACLTLIILLAMSKPLCAQTKKTDAATVLFFPAFYHHGAVRKGDTTYSYECYDSQDRRVNADTLRNADIVSEIVFVSSFFDRRYGGGPNISPPYLTKKILAYNKTGKDTWGTLDMTTNYRTELKAYPHEIVHTDTTVAAPPATGMTIRKYYKVAEIKEAVH